MSYPGIESKNKFYVIGGILVGLALLYFALVYESDPKPRSAQAEIAEGEASQRPGDADSIADSMKNMVVMMQEQKEQIDSLQMELDAVKKKQYSSDEDLTQLANNQRATNEALVSEVEDMLNSQTAITPQDVNVDSYPINREKRTQPVGWLETIEDQIYGGGPDGIQEPTSASLVSSFTDTISSLGDSLLPEKTINEANTVKNAIFEDTPLAEKNSQPVYTIPKNSTIFNSYLATSLVGRLPTNNQLSNPYRFKILTGPEGIASNSIELPEELSAMTFSGTAIGDWGLSCASGKIDSVTFTFNDGEIVTIDGKVPKGIGWISDE